MAATAAHEMGHNATLNSPAAYRLGVPVTSVARLGVGSKLSTNGRLIRGPGRLGRRRCRHHADERERTQHTIHDSPQPPYQCVSEPSGR